MKVKGIQILVFFTISMLTACEVAPSTTPLDISVIPNKVTEEMNITAQINDEKIQKESDRILDFALSPDGDVIAIYKNTGIYLYNLSAMEMTPFVEFDNSDYSKLNSGAVAFSHNGRLIAISGKFSNQEISI